ncbi:hypothetical protein NQ314_012920 [Rhamnusium bicolor]|uniref:THAP-type domain-containing protein n=1 Tax=Rhamnusium bicolor TaxID=1586634 RepID=A0AAV8X9U4_9CUCU|nr:hypothetical protein NQ314_012920 [Rhamnusium bicolor]
MYNTEAECKFHIGSKMVCCSAINCSNRTEKGWKLYRYPADPKRGEVWVCNMRRSNNWKPTSSSPLRGV